MNKLIFMFMFVLSFVNLVFTKNNLRNKLEYIDKSFDNSFKIKLPIINFPYSNTYSVAKSADTGINTVFSNNETYDPASYSILPSLLNAIYLFSAVCFILCLKGLSDHKTSRRGNILGCVGIIAAIIATFSQVGFGFHYGLFMIVTTLAVMIGFYIAHNVDMIDMPQMVALFHSFVGLSALLVGFSKFHSKYFMTHTMNTVNLIELYIGTFIASITFIGSLVAAGKLSGLMDSKSLRLAGKRIINVLCMIIIISLGYIFITQESTLIKTVVLYSSLIINLFLGFHLIASIGSADMPVVISVLNSYSGFATAISGFLLNNTLLIISGSLIGSSGAILSYIMCLGMNRDIINIILGDWEDIDSEQFIQDKQKKKSVNTITHKFAADMLINSKKIVIVPGYGVAVSKCQRELSEIASILKSRNIDVSFAIHPVAGRMPGHLNVLLAEANIPYNIVKEMSDINPILDDVDVALVIGANDIVNPSSFDTSSKIYGMPVIEVWKAKKVIVMKRSLATGYSAIDNLLFYYSNTSMLFGDAKFSTNQILTILNDYISHKGPILLDIDYEHKEKAKEYKEGESIILSETPSSDLIKDIDEESYPKPRKTIGLLMDEYVQGEYIFDQLAEAQISNMTIVPITPKYIPNLRKMGFRVLIEENIGKSILINNEEYEKYGAEITTRQNILNQSNILLKVDPPKESLIQDIPNNTVMISYIWPGMNSHLLKKMVEDPNKKNVTYIAIDEVPRTTRAQKLDIRTSMSNLQGYRAVLEAFYILPIFSKASITAAGKIKPAKVFVIGAGVAGLQAIITAKSLGAIVYAHDTRDTTEEEVKSCGGIFIKVPYINNGNNGLYANETSEEYKKIQSNIYKKIIKKCDIVICTASIPGKKSPKLVTTDMIKLMKPGSVAVDLSTEFGDKENNWGGNIECSVSNKNVLIDGVHVLGRDKIERNMPLQASDLFSMNIINLLDEMGGGLHFNIDMNNDIIKYLVVVHNGNILYSPDKKIEKIPKSDSIFVAKKTDAVDVSEDLLKKEYIKPAKNFKLLSKIFASDICFYILLIGILICICIFGSLMSTKDLQYILLFILSTIVGYYCIWSVTPSLHTPLMSVTNALSGVIIIGSMLEYENGFKDVSTILSVIATFLAAINLSGGFYVTKRMLDMFSV